MLNPMHSAFDPRRISLRDLGRTHFIGIGGAGMSVLAELLHGRGVAVDGSDRERSAKTDRLERLGIPVQIGQRATNVIQARTVVWSSAIKESNPEIRAALAAGSTLAHRSDILALLLAHMRAVTVAGAHGKTTTSALLAHLLVHAGEGDLADPSFAIGGSVRGPSGVIDGGHAGSGSVLIAEADESDGSFEKYRPAIAIITNAEADHLDHYHTSAAYEAAFGEYARHATGHVIVCADDPGARRVLGSLEPSVLRRTVAYTTQDSTRFDGRIGAVVRIMTESEQTGSGEERFTVRLPTAVAGGRDDLPLSVRLHIPGIHNARNATASLIAATLLGVNPHRAAAAAASFLGASRRFETLGVASGVTVVDDYAHHPTEIAALLDAARRRYPHATLRVLFQPHLFSRTRFFADEFARALAKADDVIVTGVFPARERQQDFPDVGPQMIVDAARADPARAGTARIEAVADMHEAAQMLALRAHRGDVLFSVGAGDITETGPVMLHALQARGVALRAPGVSASDGRGHA